MEIIRSYSIMPDKGLSTQALQTFRILFLIKLLLLHALTYAKHWLCSLSPRTEVDLICPNFDICSRFAFHFLVILDLFFIGQIGWLLCAGQTHTTRVSHDQTKSLRPVHLRTCFCVKYPKFPGRLKESKWSESAYWLGLCGRRAWSRAWTGCRCVTVESCIAQVLFLFPQITSALRRSQQRNENTIDKRHITPVRAFWRHLFPSPSLPLIDLCTFW